MVLEEKRQQSEFVVSRDCNVIEAAYVSSVTQKRNSRDFTRLRGHGTGNLPGSLNSFHPGPLNDVELFCRAACF